MLRNTETKHQLVLTVVFLKIKEVIERNRKPEFKNDPKNATRLRNEPHVLHKTVYLEMKFIATVVTRCRWDFLRRNVPGSRRRVNSLYKQQCKDLETAMVQGIECKTFT